MLLISKKEKSVSFLNNLLFGSLSSRFAILRLYLDKISNVGNKIYLRSQFFLNVNPYIIKVTTDEIEYPKLNLN